MGLPKASCDDEDSFSGLLRSLHEVSLDLATQKDTDSLCRLAVSWGLAHLGFDRLSLWFIDPLDPLRTRGTWGTDERGNLRDERGATALRDIAPQEFYEGTVPVLHFPDAPCYDDHRREVGRADKALAPLWDGHVIIGELAADNFLTRRPIGERDLEVLVILARIVAHLHTLLGAREALARMSEARGTLLKELKHRTRNNLNVITGLVTLESVLAEGEEAREKLGSLRDRVDALGSLYSLLDHDAEGAPLSLDHYLGTVASRLVLAHGADTRGIVLELHLESVTIDDYRAASLGIALNELLTDCLKYAFGGGRSGKIEVSLTRAETDVVLEVRDDGPGLPEGLDPHAGSGMGLGLVSALARQVRGRLECRNDGGAVFTLRFPAE